MKQEFRYFDYFNNTPMWSNKRTIIIGFEEPDTINKNFVIADNLILKNKFYKSSNLK